MLATLALLAAAPPRAAAQDPEPAAPSQVRRLEDLAGRFAAAWREKDREAMERLSDSGGVDLFLVADALFGRHVRAVQRDPDDPGDDADALREFAALAGRHRHLAGLPETVKEWLALDGEDLRRAGRLRAAAIEAHRWWDGVPAEAILERTAAAAKEAGEARPGVSGFIILNARASALLSLERLEECIGTLDRARPIARALRWPASEVYCLNWKAEALCRLRRHDESVAVYGEAIEAARAASADRRLAQAFVGRALALSETGRSEPAAEDCARAWTILKEARIDPEGLLDTLAQVLAEIGRFPQAQEAAALALRLAEAAEDTPHAIRALVVLGMVATEGGRLDDALSFFERAQALDPGNADPALQGPMALAWSRLGRHDRAIAIYRRIAEEFRGPDPNELAAKAAVNLGIELLIAERFDEAHAILGKARERRLARGDAGGAAHVLATISDGLAQQGRIPEAREALTQALGEMEAQGATPRLAWARARLGWLEARDGRPERGRELLAKAAADQDAMGDTRKASDTRAQLAAVMLGLGDPAGARVEVRRALEQRLAADRGLGEDDATPLREDHRDLADLGLAAIAAGLEREPDRAPALAREALWFAEAGRGLLLADQIVNREALLRAALPAGVAAAVEDAEAAVRAARGRLVRLAPGTDADAEARAAARAGLESAHIALRDSRARAARAARRAVALVHPEPVAPEVLQAALPADAALVVYQLAERQERAGALVVTREALVPVVLGPAAALRERAEAWLDVLAARAPGEAELARSLHDALIGPIAEALAGRSRLVIVPDGVLAFLPFEALLAPPKEPGAPPRRLVQDFVVAYAPSATVFESLLRDEAARADAGASGIVALADPARPAAGAKDPPALASLRDFDHLGPLPESAAEARAVAALFPEDRRTLLLGERATRDGLLAALAASGGRRLAALHLACHGVVDSRSPCLTGLVLAGHEILGLDDLYGMAVPARLAVLSACETGRGRLSRGEGVMGLVRGFFHAGCPRVVVTDWKVSDRSARDFQVAFYGSMVRDGLPPAAALRAAKLAALAAGGARAGPSEWAAFVLWGHLE